MAQDGRLVVYAPRHGPYDAGRLRIIASAARRAARNFGIGVDGVFRRDALSVNVYYEDTTGERWVYSDWEMSLREDEVSQLIHNLVFLLTHAPHPQTT